MKSTIDINLMEELSNLEYFIVKTPVNSPEFWKEWQEKYSRAYVSKIAVKKLLKTKRLTYEDIKRYRAMLEMYEGLLLYLESLKRLALKLRGVIEISDRSELDDEDIDFDF